jgi:hypothetical protein
MAIERGKKGPSLWVSHNKHGKITGPTCGILFFLSADLWLSVRFIIFPIDQRIFGMG